MAKLPRINQKLFASTATLTQVGKFGSLAAGSAESAATTDEVQELNQFEGGWYSAILGNNNPAIQDMNGVFKLAFQQIAYILQQGIPEWIATTEYHEGSIVRDAAGVIYRSLTDDNLGNALTDTNEWVRVDGFANVANYDNSNTALALGDAGKIILCNSTSGDVNLALPTAVSANGLKFTVKKTASANKLILTPDGSEEIWGQNEAFEMAEKGDMITFISDGSNWQIIAKDIQPMRCIAYSSGTPAPSSGVPSAVAFGGANPVDNYDVLGANSVAAPWTGWFDVKASVGWNAGTFSSAASLTEQFLRVEATDVGQITRKFIGGTTSTWSNKDVYRQVFANKGELIRLIVEQSDGSGRSYRGDATFIDVIGQR